MSKRMLRASGELNYINEPTLNTGSVAKNVYGGKNPKKLQKVLKQADKVLDKIYDKYKK